MTHTTKVAQHRVEKIKITEKNRLSSGTYTRDIEIHTENGKLNIEVYAEDGKEDIEVEVE